MDTTIRDDETGEPIMHYLALFTTLHQQHIQELQQEAEQYRLCREIGESHRQRGHPFAFWWSVREDITHWWKQAMQRKETAPVTGKEVCCPCC